MSRKVRLIVVLHLVALTLALAARTTRVATQEPPRGMLSLDKSNTSAAAAAAQHNPTIPAECRGPVAMVTDVGFEGVKTTGFNFSNNTGGGESGRFDKRPVLTTKVRLEEGTCLNAHFSAIVGSRQTYGVASITMFQVTLTPAGGAPQHMYGHYETPYGTLRSGRRCRGGTRRRHVRVQLLPEGGIRAW